VNGAGNHISGDLVIPRNITLSPLPAYSSVLYIERNRKVVKSIASFPYIVKSS
jgi:hypothetical protein